MFEKVKKYKYIYRTEQKEIKPAFTPSFLNNQNIFDEAVQETNNGLCLNNTYIPEIIFHILTYVEPKEILKYSLVCCQWNKLIKSYQLWSTIYKRKYNRRAKKLPWYLYYCLLSTNYFDTNLLRNGNGQDGFAYWEIKAIRENEWTIENSPLGVDPLPLDVPEFSNKTSCFATPYYAWDKVQQINLGNSKLFQYILNSYKPHIYLSEWTAGSFECESIYRLGCAFIKSNETVKFTNTPYALHYGEPRQVYKWKKKEITITEYPEEVKGIIFMHQGGDRLCPTGRYGRKMAGGVVKLLFDTIEPLPTDDDGNEIPKMFSKIQFESNGDIYRPYECEVRSHPTGAQRLLKN